MKPADALSSALDKLPMFASDREIAEAIAGKRNAGKWLEKLPVLESKLGFPKIDEFHGGRPVPLVRLFYLNYLRLPRDMKGAPDGEDDDASWNRRSRMRRASSGGAEPQSARRIG